VVGLGRNLVNKFIKKYKLFNILKMFKFGKKRGQGILEVVIAMSVIVMGLISIMSLVFFNINVQAYNHNMLVASNLAREGIEVVRNVRDSNWFNSEIDWDDSLFDGNTPGGEENSFVISNRSSWDALNFDYGLSPAGISWEDCIINDAFCRLYLTPILGNPEYKIYNYGRDLSRVLIADAEVSNFYRMIYINEICDTGTEEKILTDYGNFCGTHGYTKIGMQVISKVGWENKGSMKTIEVEERIYDWK
jgi:hypothetical protein